ncbi:glycosyl hydrolase family 18 protein [Tumebacillus permanentifrigoris]|uniref:Spore germination protein YaaH n=1 Tax=Tumebacillus permanentifrigoris TaxID=378543 RepID=A0A316D474_9BACL|nr:glycosyl hydrolase family 18 protein [Tumebacillus permanentifrigoris]PWK05194.1 spore germination protein YaaH [Tumebacillus permanentifrigoris]
MEKKVWVAALVVAAGALLASTQYATHATPAGKFRSTPTVAPVVEAPTSSDPFGPPIPEPRAQISAPKAVLGYYTVSNKNKASLDSLLAFGGGFLNQMTTMTFAALPDGTIAGVAPQDGLQAAQSKNVKAYAALTNGKDGFSPEVAHAILSDSAVRAKLVHNAVALLQQNGYGGLNVDFENMLPGDRANFTAFVTELATALHTDGRTVIISVMAKTSDSPTRDWVGTFDYAALGQVADQIQLMTYDEHGTWGEPGAVAGLPWVENVITYASAQIPPQKLLLGLPAYGYDWNTNNAKQNKAVTLKNIPALLQKTGAVQQWSAVEQSPYFTYQADDGSTHHVWFENPESITAKTKLVPRNNLAGVAVWRMGFEDDAFWQAVKTGLEP